MNLKEYKRIEKFEKTYWWHIGRLFLLEKLVKRYFSYNTHNLFLEIGCGTGETMKLLNKYGDTTGLDISQEAIDYCRKKGLKRLHKRNISTMNIDPHIKKYDGIFALDVLEHIQDDVHTMTRAAQMLKNGGIFVIMVPAHKFLWSEHDEALHHKRRYHSLEITQKLDDAGFDLIKKSYFVTLGFFPITFFRFWNNIFGKTAYPKTSYVNLPIYLNKFVTYLLKLEAYLVIFARLPVGTTIVAVARKR